MSSTRSAIALNTLVGVMTAAALVVVGSRLRSAYFPEAADDLKPVTISDWRLYAATGEKFGPSNAPIVVTEFSDFPCPFCRQFATDLALVRRSRPGKVRVVYRYYPLLFHPQAVAAAHAAICASVQGMFESMHDRLFEGQDSLGYRNWQQFAQSARVKNLSAFNRCMTDTSSALAIIRRDSLAATRLEVRGTPTVLINDQKIVGSPGRDLLAHYIDLAISAAPPK